MANFSATLISSTDSGVPPGPYSGPILPYYSEFAKGVGYYRQANGLHTVSYTTNGGFVGTIKMQGTLAVDPANTDWVDIPETVFGDGVSVVDGTFAFNFSGNFVWVRAAITVFAQGAINSVLYTHS